MSPRSGGGTARKVVHKIGDVCKLTQTEPYVLRYWESEFPFLAPEKNRAGQRVYTDDDVQTVLAIKRLLYEEGYTTAGARRKLEQERREPTGTSDAVAEATTATPAVADAPGRVASPEWRDALVRLRGQLRDLRAELGD